MRISINLSQFAEQHLQEVLDFYMLAPRSAVIRKLVDVGMVRVLRRPMPTDPLYCLETLIDELASNAYFAKHDPATLKGRIVAAIAEWQAAR